eukprot:gb/GEZN01009781.1/.p1 GENE.gb/GEZN01009781.1/~~gb/GEZN01009781.1/.p1  ORF type:complete len:311 (-),score=35.18 gb/GEZN01009781.1/:307-1239(-)
MDGKSPPDEKVKTADIEFIAADKLFLYLSELTHRYHGKRAVEVTFHDIAPMVRADQAGDFKHKYAKKRLNSFPVHFYDQKMYAGYLPTVTNTSMIRNYSNLFVVSYPWRMPLKQFEKSLRAFLGSVGCERAYLWVDQFVLNQSDPEAVQFALTHTMQRLYSNLPNHILLANNDTRILHRGWIMFEMMLRVVFTASLPAVRSYILDNDPSCSSSYYANTLCTYVPKKGQYSLKDMEFTYDEDREKVSRQIQDTFGADADTVVERFLGHVDYFRPFYGALTDEYKQQQGLTGEEAPAVKWKQSKSCCGCIIS